MKIFLHSYENFARRIILFKKISLDKVDILNYQVKGLLSFIHSRKCQFWVKTSIWHTRYMVKKPVGARFQKHYTITLQAGAPTLMIQYFDTKICFSLVQVKLHTFGQNISLL